MRIFRMSVRQNNKGMALIFMFIVMTALSTMVISYLFFVSSSIRSIGALEDDSQAFYLAEAGMHKAIWYLYNTAPDGSSDGSWRTSSYPAAPGAGANDPRQESFGNGTYTMWVADSNGDIQITARGTMNNAVRTVRQTFSGYTWTEIIYDEFESNFGNWTDGGKDCARYTGGTRAHQGSDAVNLQDNTATSLMSTGNLALAAYNQIKVDFWYYPRGMENNEDFWLQISTNGGGGYATDQVWVSGSDFVNDSFYEASVTMTGYALTNQTRIRFRVDASHNNDDVYFDEVRVSATAQTTISLTAVANSWSEL